MESAPGIVNFHAQTTCPATPHRTALNRLRAPTPMMDPAMVWVVLTGIPKKMVVTSVVAAPPSAHNPSMDARPKTNVIPEVHA